MKNLLVSTMAIAMALSTSAQTWTQPETLSSARTQLSSGEFNDLLFFCGGTDASSFSDVVQVYDPSASAWLASQALSSSRSFAACIGGDENLYVAGGVEALTNPLLGSNIVDIYDGSAWSTHTLSESFFDAQIVHVGTKVLITGGLTSFAPGVPSYSVSDLVHIYDESTETWSTDNLSFARSNIASASNDTIAIFAGGIYNNGQVSDVVDIYNFSSDSWTTATLSQAKGNMTGGYLDGVFYFAGGVDTNGDPIDVVETFDGTVWDSDNFTISEPRAGMRAAVVGDVIFFTGGGEMTVVNLNYSTSSTTVDMYDAVNGWTSSNMNLDKINHTAIAYGDKVYTAGGNTAGAPPSVHDAVEVWDVSTGIQSIDVNNSYSLYPNPVRAVLNLEALTNGSKIEGYEIRDLSGKLVASSGALTRSIDVSALKNGTYLLNITHSKGNSVLKFVKE